MNDLFAPIQWMIFLALWRMSYETANARSPTPQNPSFLVQRDLQPDSLPASQKEWAEKAVKRYADAQEKKWRRWNEAMFEAK